MTEGLGAMAGAGGVFEAGLLIAGRQIASDEYMEVRSPADPSVLVGRFAIATGEHVDEAVSAAHAVAASWAETDACRRAAALAAAASSILDHKAELADLLCAEHGKPIAEALSEIASASDILTWHADQTDTLKPVASEGPRGRQVRRRAPLGVVAVIVPWNYPVLLAQLMIAPALLAGNTVVVKLPDHSPLALSAALLHLADQLPPGVLNVVAGSGDVVGARLAAHPDVRKVSFTGSTPTGRKIMESASTTLKNLSMELGGNDAAVVLPDRTVDPELIDELLRGTLTNAGQVCFAPKRIYVHASKQQEFCAAFVARAANIVVGRPHEEGIAMGPLNNADQVDVVRRLLEDAQRRGAAAIPLGRMADGLSPEGHWVQPHLVHEIHNTHPLVQEEQFGPLVPVITYDTVDDAVRMANDTEFGLAASVWTDDIKQAFEVAASLEAGTVFVNVHRVGASAVDMPFGGFKQSGIGRGHGVEGIYEYTELQIIAQREDMKVQ